MKHFSNLDLMGYVSREAGRVASITAALVLISAFAFGTAIGTGEANATGTVVVNSSGVFFSNFAATGPNTAGYAGNSAVTQRNLVGAPNLNPKLADWAEFAGMPGGPIKFDLTALNPGVGNSRGLLLQRCRERVHA